MEGASAVGRAAGGANARFERPDRTSCNWELEGLQPLALQPEALETTSLDGVGNKSDGAVGGCVGDIVNGVDGVSAGDVGHEGVGGW